MTIKKYLEDCKELDGKFKFKDGKTYSEVAQETTSVWSNDAVRGYLIAAAKRLKMSHEKINALLGAIGIMFDDYTQDEAEKIYFNF